MSTKINVKKATGSYIGVKAITKEEALELAHVLFSKEYPRWKEAIQLCEKRYDPLYKRAEKLKNMARSDRLKSEAEILYEQGNLILYDIAIAYRGYIPDMRAINFRAKDLTDSVYSFIWQYKEIWIYGGEYCPTRSAVEKLKWRVK